MLSTNEVRRPGYVAQRVRIHHNYFHDFTSPGPGTNGAETIRFGLSGLSMSKGPGTIELNLFVRCIGREDARSSAHYLRMAAAIARYADRVS